MIEQVKNIAKTVKSVKEIVKKNNELKFNQRLNEVIYLTLVDIALIVKCKDRESNTDKQKSHKKNKKKKTGNC